VADNKMREVAGLVKRGLEDEIICKESEKSITLFIKTHDGPRDYKVIIMEDKPGGCK